MGGKWYPLGDDAMRLSSLPDIVPLRLVLLGTPLARWPDPPREWPSRN